MFQIGDLSSFLAGGEDKTWTRWTPLFGPGPWTTFIDWVHGPPVMDQVHGQIFFYFYKKVLHQ